MKRLISILLCAALLSGLIPAALASGVTSGTAERREGYALASVRCQYEDGSYELIPFFETAEGYTYSFPTPDATFSVIPEYYSLTVWDGAVDISWYDAEKTEFYLDNPAQLAGLAALVNGGTDLQTPDYRVKGDLSLLVCTRIDDFLLVGAGGGNQHDTVYQAGADTDFSDKTVYLTADLDMGGVYDAALDAWSGPNWTPIGGKYPLSRPDSEHVIEAFFNGTLDGQGHRIENLFCDRYAEKGYPYSQAVGLVGYLGECYEGEPAPERSPAVRNLSVSGSIYGRRMVGGIVGRVGSIEIGVRIENCANCATVRNTDSKGIGGICGAGWGKGAIVNCYNTGSVSTTYACPAGGICGSNSGLDIYNCYNVGRIDSNGNGRGRAIGCHNAGSYTVSDCYYLEGCDDDPASNGWYLGTALGVTVSVSACSEQELMSEAFAEQLNNNGAAYLWQPGGFPVLWWEVSPAPASCEIAFDSPVGGTVYAKESASVCCGTVLTLMNSPDPGYAFRRYTMNGAPLSGPYATVTADAVFSAEFVPLAPGSLVIRQNPACEIAVTKDGTVIEDGVPILVSDYPVGNGDPLYEGDTLHAVATLHPDAAPEDLDYVYSGLFRYRFAFDDGSGLETATDTGVFSVADKIASAPLILEVSPYTTHKVWTQLAETDWYDESEDTFTLFTARQLAGLALLCKQGNRFAGKSVKLGRDISLSNDDDTFNRSVRWWDGIGSAANPFCGVFDGCGHTVSDLTAIAEHSNLALFIQTDGAVIRNLTVKGVASAKGGVAAFVSQAKNTVIRDCVSQVSVSASEALAGGIAALLDKGCTVERCVNYGQVSGTTGVGGIVGSVSDSGSTLADCRNCGAVSGDGTSGGLGGVAGKIGGALTRCANYGSVSGKNWYVGGVVGCANLQNASILTDCYNVGSVQNAHSYQKSATGGVIGYGSYYQFKNGFNYAAVSAEVGTVGGVIGFDSRRSANRLENAAYLDTGCEAGVGGVEAPEGVRALSAPGFASSSYLDTLNIDGCFVLQNGMYPEFDENDAACPGGIFTDMPPKGHWAHAAIDWAIERGITSGLTATSFGPDAGCTRAQVVTFLWRAMGKPASGLQNVSFIDIQPGAYYDKAVLWAVEAGITTGVDASHFAPNGPCTRGQVVTFLWRSEGKPAASSTDVPFTDVDQSGYYYPAMCWAVENGITAGVSATCFAPEKPCTRAQVVTFLYRDLGD